VPVNARIEGRTHPDDRVATVVEGTWYLGYGDRFDERELKALSPGRSYTEPSNQPHVAGTGHTPVVVHISGIGPTGTRYVDAPLTPRATR
jgi:quercetin dioxygenase-like cupin family protein